MVNTALILTRPTESSARFLAAINPQALKAVRTIISPLMEIIPLRGASDFLDQQTEVIFSSANGVKYSPEGKGRRAYCVGHETASAAIARGWDAEQLGQTADELVNTLVQRPHGAPLIHLAGTHRRGDIAERLTSAGHETQPFEVYDQRLLKLTAEAMLALKSPAIVPLFSPRTAAQFANETKDLSSVTAVAMSVAVAQSLEGTKLAALHVLEAPTRKDMLEFVENLCLRTSLP